jgi:hypothetical protein
VTFSLKSADAEAATLTGANCSTLKTKFAELVAAGFDFRIVPLKLNCVARAA